MNPFQFPSPIGVIFSLILNIWFSEWLRGLLFPSPIGVIFSLIHSEEGVYRCLFSYEFPSPIGVIFSLIVR